MGRYSCKRKEFDFGSFTITIREILASISIIAVMLVIGVLISGKISEHQADQNEIYNKAVKIENDKELFQYSMDTNIGNAFVYGDLEAVDTVTYPEIDGEYMYVKKVKEKYTEHTRKVEHTKTVNGKKVTYYTTETYWEWDYVSSDEMKCKNIRFCGVDFDSNKIDVPSYAKYIDTVKETSRIRYKYYGTDTKFTGTIFADLRNGTISNAKFYNNTDIDKTIDCLQINGGEILFWFFWIILICVCVFGFYELDNKWLE